MPRVPVTGARLGSARALPAQARAEPPQRSRSTFRRGSLSLCPLAWPLGFARSFVHALVVSIAVAVAVAMRRAGENEAEDWRPAIMKLAGELFELASMNAKPRDHEDPVDL